MPSTIAAITNRMVALVTAITPSMLESDRFRHTQDEGKGDFRDEMEQHTQGAFRRFQVSDEGVDDGVPEISSLTVEIRERTMVVLVAYPHSHRYGSNGKRARRKCIDEDYRKIYNALGPGFGQANFPSGSAHDCTLLNCSLEIEEGENVDFAVVRIPVVFYLDVDAF